MGKETDIQRECAKAVRLFWQTKNRQLRNSADSTNRGSVVGGKQLDGFLSLLRGVCTAAGVPAGCIYDKNDYIPGFFRSSKNWDFIVISPSGKLLVLIELKSQTGSYGNNFNNRTEEALGNATDLWTAYREKQFPTYGIPWIGYLMLIGLDEKATQPVKNFCNHFPVRSEFENASYLDRYRLLCEKLVTERLYTSACLIWTRNAMEFGDASEETALARFIGSLQGYLLGCADEFDH